MEFDFSNYSPKDRYKLLSSTIIPRPMALFLLVDTLEIIWAVGQSFSTRMNARKLLSQHVNLSTSDKCLKLI